MKIIVFGARGAVGSRIVQEALSRGHDVTGVLRTDVPAGTAHPTAKIVVADVSDTTAITDLLKDFDLAVSAIRPPDGREAELVPLTVSILTAAARAATRILVVGGAASLLVPGENRHSVLTAPGFLPEDVVPIARASFAQYEAVQAERQADWTYLSPPAMLAPGRRTGRYRKGIDTLLLDDQGASEISMEDFSVALLDEAESPMHRRARFTVAY